MDTPTDTEFDDFGEEIDDSEAVDAYADEIAAAVKAFGITPKETGTPDPLHS